MHCGKPSEQFGNFFNPHTTLIPREYWMKYRGPGRMIRLLAYTPFPLSPGRKLPLFLSLHVCRRSILLTGEGGGGGRWAKSYGREKARPSINHSILSGDTPFSRRATCLLAPELIRKCGGIRPRWITGIRPSGHSRQFPILARGEGFRALDTQ